MIVLWLGLCSAIAYYLFALGFLSTRLELPHRSSPYSLESNESLPASFDRVVILIVDALRADFVFSSIGPSMMPNLHAMHKEAGPTSLALRFIADVPTITMSRVKALLTGGLPTFIDIGSSFSASAVSEDNILLQSASDAKGPWRVAFMGDDTWMQLAPQSNESGSRQDHQHPPFAFAPDMSHPYPSFDTVDLHTVDRGVWSHLEPYLSEAEARRWDMLIAHFLGVDHTGHTHGAHSAEMAEKLREIDGWIKHTAEAMIDRSGPGEEYEKSLLIVLGDHGMTGGGDHGGGSREETDSLLVAFNIGAWRERRREGVADVSGSDHACSLNTRFWADADERFEVFTVAGSWVKKEKEEGMVRPDTLCGHMPQVDFAASLSVALGLPIPFSSIGRVDPSWWHMMMQPRGERTDHDQWSRDAIKQYLNALKANARQVHRYLTTYADYARIKGHSDLSRISDLFHQIEIKASEMNRSSSSDEQLSRDYLEFLGSASLVARERFLRYDLRLMVGGCVIMTLSLAGYFGGSISIASASKFASLPSNLTPSLLASFLVASMALAQGLSLFGVTWIMAEGRVQCRLLMAAVLVIWTGALGDYFLLPSSTRSQKAGTGIRSLAALFAVGPLALISIFLMQEGMVDRGGQDPHDKSEPALFKDLIGLGGEGWVIWRVILPLIALPLWFGACHLGLNLLDRDKNKTGKKQQQAFSLPWPLAMTSYLTQQILSIIWWSTRALGSDHLTLQDLIQVDLVSGWHLIPSGWHLIPLRLLLPRLVYLLTLTHLSIELVSSLLNLGSSTTRETTQMKGMQNQLWFLASSSASVTMLLGKNGPLCILLGLITASCILFICCISSPTSHIHPARIALPVCWSILSIVLFFCSGHFCEFSGLQYTSPFIGFDSVSVANDGGGDQGGSLWISGAMLSINTFGPQLLIGLAMPLVSHVGTKFHGSDLDSGSNLKEGQLVIDPHLAIVVFCLVRNFNACVSMVCTAILRRNVVIWAILAPKLVFEMFFAAVSVVSVALGSALFV